MIYSVFKSDENCYPQVFLEKCKYKNKWERWSFIEDDLKSSSDDDFKKEANFE